MEQKFRNYQITAFVKIDYNEKCKYQIICEEVCPNTGRNHWHAFVQFKNPRHLNSVKKIYKDMHVEVCKGTISENIKYIKKGEVFEEYGEAPQQGKRNDL